MVTYVVIKSPLKVHRQVPFRPYYQHIFQHLHCQVHNSMATSMRARHTKPLQKILTVKIEHMEAEFPREDIRIRADRLTGVVTNTLWQTVIHLHTAPYEISAAFLGIFAFGFLIKVFRHEL